MIRVRSVVGILAACLGVLCAPRIAPAQTEDRTAGDLAKARVTYEIAMEGIRKDVRKAIDVALDNAPKQKDNAEAVKKATAESQAFDTRGQLPELKDKAQWEQSYAAVADKMNKAYAQAIVEYEKSKLPDLRDAVTAESERFRARWDLGPWRPNLLSGKSPAERTLAPSSPLSIDLGLADEYRLEIRAKRTGEAGSLLLDLPLTDGKRLLLPAEVGKQGDVFVQLTVDHAFIGVDRGVPRPVTAASTESSDSKGLILSAQAGSFEVSSVSVKPLISGEQPQAVVKAPPKAKAPAVAPVAEDHWTQGRTWQGSDGTTQWTFTVTSRAGNDVSLTAKSKNGWKCEIDGTVSGRLFTPESATQTSGKAGARKNLKNITGSATAAKGAINVYFDIIWDKRKNKNHDLSIHVPNAKSED